MSVRHRQHVSVRHLTTRVCALAIQQDAPDKVIKAYAEAVQTVDPEKADGKPHTLWVAFAKYYEDNDDLDSARDIFVRATQVCGRSVCSWPCILLSCLVVWWEVVSLSDGRTRAFV